MKLLKLKEFYCALIFAIGVAFFVYSQVHIENVSVTRNNTQKQVELPYFEKMHDYEYFSVSFDVTNKFGLKYGLKIIPDDCALNVRIGENLVDLSQMRRRCDFSQGFFISDSIIGQNENSKTLHYEIFLRNGGGPGGVSIMPKIENVSINIFKTLLIALFSAICAMIARRFHFGTISCIIIFIGVFMRTAFFAEIPYTKFSHDVEGHIEYVQYIVNNVAIPSIDDCWTCYHPPVYYISAVPSFLAKNFFGMQGTTCLQMYSLLLSILTLFFGLFFLNKIFDGKRFAIAALLWSMWPTLILVAPRIGNDQMFYLLHIICMWGGISYLKSGCGKYLIISTISTAFAIYTKSTAFVTLAMLFIFTITGYVYNYRLLKPTKSEITAWVLMFTFIIFIALQKLFSDDNLVGNASGLNSGLRVNNDAFNYIFFDLKQFITNPFINVWNDSAGRQYFWNYALKSALTGEFDFENKTIIRTFATFTSVSFLGLLVYAIRGFWKSKLQIEHWILFIHSALFFIALMVLRIKYPYACSNDFRYILPVILSIVYFIAIGTTLKNCSVKYRVFGFCFIATFVLSSTILYILAM